MKKSIILATTIALLSCSGETMSEIIIDEQNHQNAAYDLSYELASAVKEATTYEEFRSAADNLKAYQEAFRTQIGGESYLIFIEECNTILNE